jgi:diguanylate cyclase (GGDEF)-like protein
VGQEQIGADAPGRTWSLRREWSRAFTIMLLLLLLAAASTFVGVSSLVDGIGDTAGQLNEESQSVVDLRTELTIQNETGLRLLSDEPVDLAAYLQQQQEISRIFDKAATIFPTTDGQRATIIEAHQSWQVDLEAYGLWGAHGTSLHGNNATDGEPFVTSNDNTDTLLSNVEESSLTAMDRGLAHGDDLENILIITLASLFGLAVAVTVYFRRRMVRDLVRPVATMHEGVLRLEAGDYDHRIDVSRRDELGELTAAFNNLAAAVHDSHLALTREATHDALTGLPNRTSLTQRLAASFSPGSDRRAQHESVLFIDVDDFKDVNDSLGHEGGDALLIELATRLNACVRPYDLVARLGGDEFAIVVTEDDGGSTAVEVAGRILDSVRAPFIVGGAGLVVSVSIGVAQRRPEIGDAAELLRRADFAMYMAKGSGKGRYQLFDAKMHDTMVSRSALKADLAVAVSSGQLRLEYQPVADLRTGEVLGLEALVRWHHPTLGLLLPADFITLAEETGDIDALGCWVLDTATRQVATWRATMDHCSSLWVSVNLSPHQLASPHSLAAIERILTDPAVEADNVVLEITETALAADVDGGVSSLNALKRLGVRLAIDDFGTGFSSLSTLASLPVDVLKIDRAFVSGASGSPSVPMLEGILGLAGKLSLAVIAEGIEEPAQLDLLRTLGCFTGQGYLLARPAPAATIEALLASGGLLEVTQPATA